MADFAKRLDVRFADWLRTARSFAHADARSVVSTQTTSSPPIGVRATRYSWPHVCAGCVGLIAAVATNPLVVALFDRDGVSNGSALLACGAATLVALLGFSSGTERVWAECADATHLVARDDVHELKRRVDEVWKHPVDWEPTHVYIVTSNRFERDAVTLAHAFGFECYEQTKSGFERVGEEDRSCARRSG